MNTSRRAPSPFPFSSPWAATRVPKLDDVKERFAGMDVEPGGLPPTEFAALARSETKQWGDIIVRANIKPEQRRSPPCPILPFPGRSAPPTTSAP